MGLLGFDLFVDFFASCILFTFPLDLESSQFSPNFFKYIFDHLFFFFSSGIPIMHILALFILSYRPLIFLSLFFIWFSFCCLDCMISIILSSKSIISSNIFSILFSFSSPSGIPIMHSLARFVLSHRPLVLLSCFFHLVFCLLF